MYFTQNYGERLLAQMIGAMIMIGIGLLGSFLTYLILYLVPIAPFVWVFDRYMCRPSNMTSYQHTWVLCLGLGSSS